MRNSPNSMADTIHLTDLPKTVQTSTAIRSFCVRNKQDFSLPMHVESRMVIYWQHSQSPYDGKFSCLDRAEKFVIQLRDGRNETIFQEMIVLLLEHTCTQTKEAICAAITWAWLKKCWGKFLKYHADWDNKLLINFVWPYIWEDVV